MGKVMRILVCVKQVPEFDPEAEIVIDPEGEGIVFDHLTALRMNRVDENAVEEALVIKKAFPDTAIDALSVGPEGADAAVRRAMGMGADGGIHIQTAAGRHLAGLQTAGWIAEVVRERGYDLILTGVMSEDLMQGQVGPLLAEMLGIPCATSVIAETVSEDQAAVRVEREIEGGYRDILDIRLPALLTIQSGINTPRYPSLSNVMRAKRAKLELFSSDSLQPPPGLSPPQLRYPERTRAARFLEGSPEEKAAQLYDLLQEKSIIS